MPDSGSLEIKPRNGSFSGFVFFFSAKTEQKLRVSMGHIFESGVDIRKEAKELPGHTEVAAFHLYR